MEFGGGEEKLLESRCAFSGNRRVVVLTNKRLLFFKKKGIFGKFDVLDTQIPIEEIKECYSDVKFMSGCHMKLRLKTGDEHSLTFAGSVAGLALGTVDSHVQIQKAQTDRWVNAINNLIRK